MNVRTKGFAWKLTVVGVVSLLVVVIVSLVLAIPKCGLLHRNDFLFMTMCLNESSGEFIPVKVGMSDRGKGKCDHPEEIEYSKSRFPLKTRGVTTNPNLGSSTEDSVRAAIKWANGSFGAGFPVLEWYDGTERADVKVRLGVGYGLWGEGSIDAMGAVYHRLHEGRVYAEVVTANTGSMELLHLTLCHEFGHALGLGHVDWTGSVMFPITEIPQGKLSLPRLGDDQREALQLKYMKGRNRK